MKDRLEEEYQRFKEEVLDITTNKGGSNRFLERVLSEDFSVYSLRQISQKNRNDFLCHYSECCEQGNTHTANSKGRK